MAVNDNQPIRVRDLGVLDYPEAQARMRAWTALRVAAGRTEADEGNEGRAPGDEIWLTGHPPVFTLGLDGNRAHLLDPGGIPIHETERGGQVTYHGPGQVIAYILVDLRRRRIGVRTLVDRIEAGAIAALADAGVVAHRIAGAPGLYVGGHPDSQPSHPPGGQGGEPADVPMTGPTTVPIAGRDTASRPAPVFSGARKIASIGLKVSHGFSYHGIAVNGRMDLTPFERIDPCGYPGLRMTDIHREVGNHFEFDTRAFAVRLGDALARAIGG